MEPEQFIFSNKCCRCNLNPSDNQHSMFCLLTQRRNMFKVCLQFCVLYLISFIQHGSYFVAHAQVHPNHWLKREGTPTEEEMMEVMRVKGVPYLPNYMAPTEERAKQQFPNMIDLTESYQGVHPGPHTFVAAVDNERSVKRLLQDLKRGYGVQEALEMGETHGWRGTPRIHTDTRLVQKLANLTSALLRLNFTMASNLLTKLRSQDIDELLLGRRKRSTNSDGSVTQTQYCKKRGSLTPDGSYMRMCSTCTATTTLPPDHFPRVINEVVCSSQDRGCFTVNGVAHGRCAQKVFHLNMLRKKENRSDTLSLLAEPFLSDQWEAYTQPIRVSCECEIDKLSMFSSYIAGLANGTSP